MFYIEHVFPAAFGCRSLKIEGLFTMKTRHFRQNRHFSYRNRVKNNAKIPSFLVAQQWKLWFMSAIYDAK